MIEKNIGSNDSLGRNVKAWRDEKELAKKMTVGEASELGRNEENVMS